MLNPIEQLMNEHQNILRGVKLLELTGKMALDNAVPHNEIIKLIDFFKLYADDGHHAKEEKVLFTKLYGKDISLKSANSPLSVLTEQHLSGRNLLQNISKIDSKFPFHVEDYSNLLKRHIEIEDEVFPSLASDYFNDSEIKLIMYDFQKEDNMRDLSSALRLLDIVEVSLL